MNEHDEKLLNAFRALYLDSLWKIFYSGEVYSSAPVFTVLHINSRHYPILTELLKEHVTPGYIEKNRDNLLRNRVPEHIITAVFQQLQSHLTQLAQGLEQLNNDYKHGKFSLTQNIWEYLRVTYPNCYLLKIHPAQISTDVPKLKEMGIYGDISVELLNKFGNDLLDLASLRVFNKYDKKINDDSDADFARYGIFGHPNKSNAGQRLCIPLICTTALLPLPELFLLSIPVMKMSVNVFFGTMPLFGLVLCSSIISMFLLTVSVFIISNLVRYGSEFKKWGLRDEEIPQAITFNAGS